MRATFILGIALFCSGSVFAADKIPLPPLPSDMPVDLVQPGQARPRRIVPRPAPSVRLPNYTRPAAAVPTNGTPPGVIYTRPIARPAVPAGNPDTALAWDSVLKEYTAKSGDTEANFAFAVTNIASSNVVINWVRPSCGCTVAKLPPTPWTLKPGEVGHMEFTLDLKGKHGTLFKYISVDTSHGPTMLNIRATIPQEATVAGVDQRLRNMQLALADRQIVFRGDCAACHSTPLAGKIHGEELYSAGCAICHDTPNRATMVPDLATVANPGTKDYWGVWIRHGKPGTLMPAFAKAHGGPMSDAQIESLAAYLATKFPARAAATAANPPPAQAAASPGGK